MVDARIITLTKHSDSLFLKKQNLMSVWQEMADNFYPQRADFTTQRNLGRDFAALLSTSFPLMKREQLGNSFSSLLRPTDVPWFSMTTTRQDKIDNEGRRWLQWATNLQRNAMYDIDTQFVRATKVGDHDFVTFGNCVISVELNHSAGNPLKPRTKFLFRCWHLRDMAWAETYDGQCFPVYRKWKPWASELNQVFKGNISPESKKKLVDTPYEPINVRHAVVLASEYESPAGKKWKTPYVSIFWEEDNGYILEEKGIRTKMYVIPRWQTVSDSYMGSQYGYSPAVIAGLPDARLMQSMTLVLLEAGEKATNPPLVATQEAIRSDIQAFAGGITWVDSEYDEKTGEALRPMNLDYHGIPTGMEMREDTKKTLTEAFMLDKLNLPPVGGPDMTAYETGQRIQEYIRNALPLFEPVEQNYNGQLCREIFEVGLGGGLFGDPRTIPKSLRGMDVDYTFESPLHKAIDKQKGPLFQEMRTFVTEAMAVDPSAVHLPDTQTALRDVLEGIGVPAIWLNTPEKIQKINDASAKQAQMTAMLGGINAAADTAKKVGDAGASLQPITGTAGQRVNNQT